MLRPSTAPAVGWGKSVGAAGISWVELLVFCTWFSTLVLELKSFTRFTRIVSPPLSPTIYGVYSLLKDRFSASSTPFNNNEFSKYLFTFNNRVLEEIS